MKDLLFQYMEQRFHEPKQETGNSSVPFVTISREYGCPSKLIAKELAEELNKRIGRGKDIPHWKYVNKEIIEAAAKELHLSESKVNAVISSGEIGMVDDILASFSPNYKSSQMIRKTIRDVVQGFSRQGHIILVGRAGAAIVRNHPHALHVRLMAPLEWRVKTVSEMHKKPKEEAFKMIGFFDTKRTQFLQLFIGREPDPSLFDLIINCETFSPAEVVKTIVQAMETRKMI